MKVEKIDHVGINVWDMEKAVKFFSELFETDFGPLIDIGPSPWDIRERMGPLGLDIAEPKDPKAGGAIVLKHRGEGLNGLVIKVKNLDEAVKEMKARGIREIMRINHRRGGQTWRSVAFHPKDLFGVMIELTEYDSKLHPLMTGPHDEVVDLKIEVPPEYRR